MLSYRQSLFSLVLASASAVLVQASQPAQPLQERAAKSQRVVVASVASVEARYTTNDFGDKLIVSDVQLTVEETMKGTVASALAMDLEGGTVGNITLTVSDMPKLARGERAVFFLAPNRANTKLLPHLRGHSILKLDANNRVAGTDVSLDEVRSQVRSSR